MDLGEFTVQDDGILRSVNDVRRYRCLVLENELPVVLVSDETADKAAACMCVSVGSFSDTFPGLAHALEHFMFLGSKEYPNVDEYMKFVHDHGGACNAYTASEETCYFFDVLSVSLEDALDRFASVFVEPLFVGEATDREVEAVDQEHHMYLSMDVWRLSQLDKSTSDPKNAYSKFGTGTVETLREGPRAAGVSLRDEVVRFYGEYYSSNLMRLTVLGREPLDVLARMVRSRFSAIANTGRATPPAVSGSPYRAVDRGVLVRVVPFKEARAVTVFWSTYSTRSLYRTKPERYVSSLIGHESEGSVLSFLKARGWATALVSGTSERTSGFTIFEVRVDLTVDGLVHVHDVVGAICAYARMMREHGPQKWYWEELRDDAATRFRFVDKTEPVMAVLSSASAAQRMPLGDVIAGDALFWEWDPAGVERLLSDLTPRNARVFVEAREFADSGVCTDTERWYGTKYNLEHVTEEVLMSWERDPLPEELHMPARNEFLATEFVIRGDPEAVGVPRVIQDDDLVLLWYKFDDVYRQPKAALYLKFLSPLALASPGAAVMTELFVRLTKEAVNEVAYYATVAGLRFTLQATVEGFELFLGGFSHKLPVLARRLTEAVASLEGVSSQAAYDRIHEAYSRELRSFDFEQPYQHVMYTTRYVTEVPRWHVRDKAKAVVSVTRADVMEHVRRVLRSHFVEAFVHGNATPDEARAMVATALGVFTVAPLSSAERSAALPRATCLPYDIEHVVTLNATNPDSTNHAIEVSYYAGVPAPETSCRVLLAAQMLSEAAFSQLRTAEQLGYVVSASSLLFPTTGIRVLIQSARAPPTELDRRVEAFLMAFGTTVEGMSDEEYAGHVATVQGKLLVDDKTPAREAQRLWTEINQHQYVFNRKEVEAAAVGALPKADFISFFKDYLVYGGRARRKLVSAMLAAKEGPPNDGTAVDAEGGEVAHGDAGDDDEVPQTSSVGVADVEGRAGTTVERPEAPPLGPRLTQAEGRVVAAHVDAARGHTPAPLPVVDVTDIDAFRSSLALYPAYGSNHPRAKL